MTSKYYTCKACNENSKIKSMASDRVELERDMGETFRATCTHCHDSRTVHVNDVKAEPNKIVLAAGGLAGVVATVALWQVGFIAVISLALPGIVYGAQAKAASTFNGYKIKVTKK